MPSVGSPVDDAYDALLEELQEQLQERQKKASPAEKEALSYLLEALEA